MEPETRYTKTLDGVSIAYQVRGSAPVDLIYVTGFATNLEVELENPNMLRFMNGLSSFARVILFDKRGTGLSDRFQTPDLEMRADDIRAVLDAVDSERAFLFGESEGGALAAFFAATHPDRALGLIVYGSHARSSWAHDYPLGMPEEKHRAFREEIAAGWTSGVVQGWVEEEAPSRANDADFVRWYSKSLRHAVSPAAAIEFEDVRFGIDVRSVLPSVQAPTLVLERAGVWSRERTAARDFAERIPGALFSQLTGGDYILVAGDVGDVVAATERFVQSIRTEQSEFDRVLATLLFTDIVGSTAKAAELGDRGWGELVARHHAIVRSMLGRYRGVEIDTAGDGFFATFDGPARAIRCAQAILEAIRPLGIEVRAGVHTGEVETINDKVGGLAVTIAARTAAKARASEVLVSQTVKDLIAGSGLALQDAGEHDLKGIPDRWRLYRVAGGSGHQAL